jgi:IclR family transcriptional regulator, acetate operon repressor
VTEQLTAKVDASARAFPDAVSETTHQQVLARAPLSDAHGVGSVDRAIDVLMLFGRSMQPSLGVTEIAHELGMSKSGVHRILSTLRRRRLVTFNAESRKYALGQASVALSQSYISRLDLQAVASSTLDELMAATHETTTLAVRRHGFVTHRASSLPDSELRLEVALGRPSPLHCTAAGKAFLAFLPEDEAEDFFQRAPLAPVTETTITDADVLRVQVARARAVGYATSHGERIVGAASLASPVFDNDGYPVAALTVCGPSSRLDVEDRSISAALVAAAAGLSQEMGHSLAP